MGCLGNIIWFLFGGCIMGLGWLLTGVLWCLTIVGIPIGIQCFKFAKLAFFPFGKEICYGGGAGSLLLNIIWLLVSGLPLALEAALAGGCSALRLSVSPSGSSALKLPSWR